MEQNNTNKNQQNKINKSPDEFGAAWLKTNDSGHEYLSIKLNFNNQEYFFKGFLNSHKKSKSDKRPDFIIYKSKDNSNKQKNENYQTQSDAELQDREYQRLINQDKTLRNKKLD